jgi:hypothetical protein
LRTSTAGEHANTDGLRDRTLTFVALGALFDYIENFRLLNGIGVSATTRIVIAGHGAPFTALKWNFFLLNALVLLASLARWIAKKLSARGRGRSSSNRP